MECKCIICVLSRYSTAKSRRVSDRDCEISAIELRGIGLDGL